MGMTKASADPGRGWSSPEPIPRAGREPMERERGGRLICPEKKSARPGGGVAGRYEALIQSPGDVRGAAPERPTMPVVSSA